MTTTPKPLQIIPLGGVGEIGKNMTAIRYGNHILVVDAGLKFPDEEMLGVDIVIPDISYLVKNQKKVLGIVLTHGHEDHIGALPYVLRQLNVPIYGTRLTLGLVRAKLEEHRLLGSVELNEVAEGDIVKLKRSFAVEFIRVSHSIPDAVGLAIRTPAGVIVHTGDFKFDYAAPEKSIDAGRFARLGDEGVLVMMTDTTNAEKKGYTPSEQVVYDALDEAFAQAEGRIIVASFASNIHRIQEVYNAAAKYGRRVVVIGRSMAKNSDIAAQLGYLNIPDGTALPMSELAAALPEKTVVMTTGSQGEPLSALSRMASDEHKKIKIGPGDTVIISATPIPGNEDLVMRTINNLFRQGAKVIYDAIAPVHVSGHGNQEDLKLMLSLVKPQYVMPVHGEPRHFSKYVELAESMGYGCESIIQLTIGDILQIDAEGGFIAGKVDRYGSVLVDGTGVGDVSDVVLRDRWHLAQDGVMIVVLTMDNEAGDLLAGPDLVSRGFVIPEHEEDILQEASGVISARIDEIGEDGTTDLATVKTGVRSALGKFLYERTGRRPMIIPVIVEL